MDRNLRAIKGCPGYKASRDGDIFSATGHKLSQSVNPAGYRTVGIRIDGHPTSRTVHRLVALAWLPVDDPAGLVVDHINCDRTDNRAANLRWVSQKDNMANESTRANMRASHATRRYRTQDSQRVRQLWAEDGYRTAQRQAHADPDYINRQSAAKRAMWSDEAFRASYKDSIAHMCSALTCVETGVSYPSLRDAAKAVGCSPSTLCRALQSGAKVLGKYTFTKEDL